MFAFPNLVLFDCSEWDDHGYNGGGDFRWEGGQEDGQWTLICMCGLSWCVGLMEVVKRWSWFGYDGGGCGGGRGDGVTRNNGLFVFVCYTLSGSISQEWSLDRKSLQTLLRNFTLKNWSTTFVFLFCIHFHFLAMINMFKIILWSFCLLLFFTSFFQCLCVH